MTTEEILKRVEENANGKVVLFSESENIGVVENEDMYKFLISVSDAEDFIGDLFDDCKMQYSIVKKENEIHLKTCIISSLNEILFLLEEGQDETSQFIKDTFDGDQELIENLVSMLEKMKEVDIENFIVKNGKEE